MALQKDYDYLGKTANYWKITRLIPDYITNTTMVELRLYWDKEARDNNAQNFLQYREVLSFPVIDLTRATAYTYITKSVKDANNNETNWFADASPVLEAGQMVEEKPK